MENNNRTIPKQPLGITAYQKIYQKIITLAYKPGQRLEEKRLMEELNLGRTPIREALLRLIGEKLVESHPGKGAIVRPITLQNIKATFEMMKILETGVADLMVRHDVMPYLEPMMAASRAVKSAIAQKDVLGLVEANHDFHLNYARCSYNDYLFSFVNAIRTEAKRLSYLSYSAEMNSGTPLTEHYRSVIAEHEEIMTYLREKNSQRLKQTVLEHINTFQTRIIRYMST
jgi:DNA-binding GntR family transcriptional regulator